MSDFITDFRRVDKTEFTMLKAYAGPYGIFHKKSSKHLTVFSLQTVNIKKMANLTANTKNYGQITLNT